MDELKKVDRTVEEGWLEFSVQVNVILWTVEISAYRSTYREKEILRFYSCHVVGEPEECGNMDGKLTKN